VQGGNELAASRAALLELRRERELIEQGHRFLDEKRMQLARELLRLMAEYEAMQREFETVQSRAQDALVDAISLYGLADLQSYPPPVVESPEWTEHETWFLGLSLPVSRLSRETGAPRTSPAIERPGAEETGRRYAKVVEMAASGAALLTAMFGLEAEYKRTERAVRALENVVMPEIRQREKSTGEALAEVEQEEAIRVRLFGR
jgi:V/A-type H+-transporting ATPase subunit D